MIDENEYAMDWGKISLVISVVAIAILGILVTPQLYNIESKVQEQGKTLGSVSLKLDNDLEHLTQNYDSLSTGYSNLTTTCDKTLVKYDDITGKFRTCESDKSSLNSDLIGTKSSLQTCTTDKSNLTTVLVGCQNQINTIAALSIANQGFLNQTLLDLQTNLTLTRSDYENLVNNTARTRCCVFVNQTTANYTLQSNTITCSSSGNRTVSC